MNTFHRFIFVIIIVTIIILDYFITDGIKVLPMAVASKKYASHWTSTRLGGENGGGGGVGVSRARSTFCLIITAADSQNY